MLQLGRADGTLPAHGVCDAEERVARVRVVEMNGVSRAGAEPAVYVALADGDACRAAHGFALVIEGGLRRDDALPGHVLIARRGRKDPVANRVPRRVRAEQIWVLNVFMRGSLRRFGALILSGTVTPRDARYKTWLSVVLTFFRPDGFPRLTRSRRAPCAADEPLRLLDV